MTDVRTITTDDLRQRLDQGKNLDTGWRISAPRRFVPDGSATCLEITPSRARLRATNGGTRGRRYPEALEHIVDAIRTATT